MTQPTLSLEPKLVTKLEVERQGGCSIQLIQSKFNFMQLHVFYVSHDCFHLHYITLHSLIIKKSLLLISANIPQFHLSIDAPAIHCDTVFKFQNTTTLSWMVISPWRLCGIRQVVRYGCFSTLKAYVFNWQYLSQCDSTIFHQWWKLTMLLWETVTAVILWKFAHFSHSG